MKRIASEPVIDPNRLFTAADAILRAVNSPDGCAARLSMQTGPQRAGDAMPITVFTPDELIEAMAMLMRMDLLPVHPASGTEAL